MAVTIGCGPGLTKEQQVELRRARYTATLQSLTVKQDPQPVEPPAEASGVAAQAGPLVRTDAILDIVVTTTSDEPLPGVTIDVEHFDASRRAKSRSTFWVDTSQLSSGQSAQVTHVLENVVWHTGDTYAVSVRTPIPEAERADYREFGVPAR